VLDIHPYDRASNTILVLNLSNPHPPIYIYIYIYIFMVNDLYNVPYSGEIYKPAYPYYAASLNTSFGK